MEYKYHCQNQAEHYAASVIPVPENYPVMDGLQPDFPIHFARLADLAKEIYADMAKSPESYGLALISTDVQERNPIRKSHNSLHRLCDTLCSLSQCGKLINHQLIVSVSAFKEMIKKAQGAVSASVPKYELILSRLIDFGFVISDFNGKPFAKNVESFTIEYPDYPDMVDAVKGYCDGWDKIKNDRSSVKIWRDEFHHHFYTFDYKMTADHDKITVQQWIADEAKYYGHTDEIRDFYIAFYEYSLRYKGVTFNGDYNYKSKRIARDLPAWFGERALSLILKNMDSYITEIEAMPESIKAPFRINSCNHCGFQGATDEFCKFRRKWTLEKVAHEACAHFGFKFRDFDISRVPDYWRLLERDFGLKEV